MKQITLDKYHFKSHLHLNHQAPKDSELLKSKMIHQLYRKGQSIFVEGSYPAGVFLLKKGKAKKS